MQFFSKLTLKPVEEFEELIPWLVYNIYAEGMTHVIDQDEVIVTCTKLVGQVMAK